MSLFNWGRKKKEEFTTMLRPVDLAIQSGVQNLSAFDVFEREEIMDGIAARAFPEKRHIHKNPKKGEVTT
jgi:hypothetical protein